jgi:FSR family fosmidomycin resistance protein-like MFS transporter
LEKTIEEVEAAQGNEARPVEASEPATFQTAQVLTIAGGHFVHDTYSAFVAPILPLLQEKLSTGYALTGGLTIFLQLPSLINPFIGYVADKVSLRYFIILAPAVTATIIGFAGMASDYLTLALLFFAAGISVATFHAPAPAMIGRLAGGRIGKGMSVFMASGELGRTVGPIVVVAGVGWFGLEGIWRLAFGGWLATLVLYFRLRHVSARPRSDEFQRLAVILPRVRELFLPLTWLTLARISLLVSVTTYLPIYMRDARESSLWLAAASLTILEAAGVAGALLTGTWSDRLGRKKVLYFLLSAAPLLMFAFLVSPPWLTVPLLLALGLTAISPTPVILALVQDQFPENRALANGLFLALNFLTRAFGTWLVGWLADWLGLSQAYMWGAALALLSLPALARLPSPQMEAEAGPTAP